MTWDDAWNATPPYANVEEELGNVIFMDLGSTVANKFEEFGSWLGLEFRFWEYMFWGWWWDSKADELLAVLWWDILLNGGTAFVEEVEFCVLLGLLLKIKFFEQKFCIVLIASWIEDKSPVWLATAQFRKWSRFERRVWVGGKVIHGGSSSSSGGLFLKKLRHWFKKLALKIFLDCHSWIILKST